MPAHIRHRRECTEPSRARRPGRLNQYYVLCFALTVRRRARIRRGAHKSQFLAAAQGLPSGTGTVALPAPVQVPRAGVANGMVENGASNAAKAALKNGDGDGASQSLMTPA